MINTSYKLFFQTLSNANRWKIVNLLQNGDRNVSQICEELKIEQSTVSHALRRLERCGFVTLKPNGKERIYILNTKTFLPLLKLMEIHMDTYCKVVMKNK